MNYACLPATDSPCLRRHRLQSGWEVCVEADMVWVRAPQPPDAQWRALPFVERFYDDSAERLIRVGQSVPCRRVPEGAWMALEHYLPVPRVATILGGVRPPPVIVLPVRAGRQELVPDLLIVAWSDWKSWVLTAPMARLEPLTFALASDARVCVRGLPSAPLKGDAWVLHKNIALRAGWAFPSHCAPRWLAEMLDVPPGGIALWHEDGSAEVLPSDAFLPATRSNVRACSASIIVS